MSGTREGVPPQPERARARFSTLNASAGHEPHNALVGMSMRWVVLKSRLETGRVMEVECVVVVLDAGRVDSRISFKNRMIGTRPANEESVRIRVNHYIPNPNSPNPQPKKESQPP